MEDMGQHKQGTAAVCMELCTLSLVPASAVSVKDLMNMLQDKPAGRPQFDSSAMGCEYHDYRRKDVLHCLARPKGQAALVMIGEYRLVIRYCHHTSAP